MTTHGTHRERPPADTRDFSLPHEHLQKVWVEDIRSRWHREMFNRAAQPDIKTLLNYIDLLEHQLAGQRVRANDWKNVAFEIGREYKELKFVRKTVPERD